MDKKEPTAAELTQEIIDSLGKAAGCCGQLIHSHGHPGFILVRKMLESIKDDITKSALAEYNKVMYLRPL